MKSLNLSIYLRLRVVKRVLTHMFRVILSTGILILFGVVPHPQIEVVGMWLLVCSCWYVVVDNIKCTYFYLVGRKI